MERQKIRLLVTVKAYPAIGKRHGEAVCVAGIDVERPRWIRLFPVPFRDMPFDQRFKKFDVIELDAAKASDPRPESYQPNVDTIAKVDHLPPKRADDRRRLVEPLMQPSMCAIRRQQAANATSLGVFRLTERPELRIVENRTPWEPEKQMVIDQPSMLMPGKKGLEKVPFRFSYRYRCPGDDACRGHDQSRGQRVDKERLIDVKEVTLPNGRTDQVSIYAKDGAPEVGRLNDEGEMTFIPIERVRTQRFERVEGFRWYAQYRLPVELGGSEITLRLHGNDEDAKKKLNRAENLRAIPRSDPDFARLYARRGDAESINRALADNLYLNRAHSEGHLRQTADLLGFALMVNSLTLARHRAREAVKAAA